MPTSDGASSLDDLLGHLADHVAELVTVVDSTGTFVWVGEGARRLLGRAPADLVGTDPEAIVHPDDLPVGRERFVGVMASGKGNAEPVRYRLAHADGRWIPVELVTRFVALPGDDLVVVLSGRAVDPDRSGELVLAEITGRITAMFDDAAIGLAQVGLDGTVLRANRSMSELLGAPAVELTGRPFLAFVHPDDRPSSGPTPVADLDGRQVRLVSGAEPPAVRHVQAIATVVREQDGADLYLLLQLLDVTETVLAREALAESEQRLRSILELAQEGVVALDSSLVITFVNRRLADLMACEPDDLVGRSGVELFDRLESPTNGIDLYDPSTHTDDGSARFEARLRAFDGTERWVMISANASALADPEGHGSVVAMVSDIAVLKTAEDELRHRSSHDSLTGLVNRTFLDDRRHDLQRVGRDVVGLAVIYLDLDGFKEVNDTYGHHLGDRMLAAVAIRLQAAVRGTDVLVRLGGDEFLVWIETEDERGAVRLADRLLYNLVDPFVVGGHTVSVGASAGVAVGRTGEGLDDLMRRADGALYDAKHAGGRRFVVHGPDVAVPVVAPLATAPPTS